MVGNIYVFGCSTAAQIIRRAGDEVAHMPHRHLDIRAACAETQGLLESDWPEWLDDSDRIHLVVANKNETRKGGGIVPHVWGTLHNMWPVIKLEEGFFVSAPEFVFLQMALYLDEIELIYLGCELCGIYDVREGKLPERPELCTVAQIQEFLEDQHGANGVAKARRALKWVLERSRSPKETELALRLSLPRRLGGYGLPKPELNKQIKLSDDAARGYGRPCITPDLLWEDKHFALEYDSTGYHSQGSEITQDARRRIAFGTTGITAASVTAPQLLSRRDFDAIAELVRRSLGIRRHLPTSRELAARDRLAEKLRALTGLRARPTR